MKNQNTCFLGGLQITSAAVDIQDQIALDAPTETDGRKANLTDLKRQLTRDPTEDKHDQILKQRLIPHSMIRVDSS
jgi:hypothetical protein